MTKRPALFLALLLASSWFCCSRATWTPYLFTVVVEGMRESPTGAKDARRIMSSIRGITDIKIDRRRGVAICRGTLFVSQEAVAAAFPHPYRARIREVVCGLIEVKK